MSMADRWSSVLVLGAALALGCASDPGAPSTTLDERRYFIVKASRALRPTVALSDSEVDAMVALGDDDIVESFLADPRSVDGMLDLSVDLLGIPIDRGRADGRWSPEVLEHWSVVAALRAYRAGEDPLPALKSLAPPLPVGRMVPGDPDFRAYMFPELDLSDSDEPANRAAILAAELANVDAYRAWLESETGPVDMEALCGRVVRITQYAFFFEIVMGGPRAFDTAAPVLDPVFRFYSDVCSGAGPAPERATLIAEAVEIKTLLGEMFARLDPLYRTWESNPDLALEPIDLAAVGAERFGDTGGGYTEFWTQLVNSSTNYNRRRAAYVLDRYFCDDLKPVGAALPELHASGQHASNEACRSCHFKLDPMAGFFRRNGAFGVEYTDAVLAESDGEIDFDDGAVMDFARYEDAWRAPPGSRRAFDVGFIRSTRDEAQNSYGDDLGDLDAVIATAPETDRCVVQRMFEHFNGRDQAVDPGFLDDVTAEMRRSGADGFRRALTRIVTGATFHATERHTSVCYDVAPGAAAANRPPCAVASFLTTYCAACHSAGVRQGGLDLTAWTVGEDGAFGFPHVDAAGRSIAREATLAAMVDRLRTNDLTRQMPMAREMPLQTREHLVLWLEQQLGR
jgi:hypothetical protein